MNDTIPSEGASAQFTYVTPEPYYYLWHLVALGVIQVAPASANHACPTVTGTAWDAIGKAFPKASAPAVVAMIDVGVSRMHPNLASRIDGTNSIDLTSHPHGARSRPPAGATPFDAEDKAAFFTGLTLAGLGNLGLDADQTSYLDGLVAELAGSQGVVRTLLDAEETFASHGTAVAGLVVGEPAASVGGAAQVDPAALAAADTAAAATSANRNLIPYFGVDPFSKLISIKTGFESDPEQFIAAFLYAWNCKADVILLPRGLPDPLRSVMHPKVELGQNLAGRDGRERADLLARLALAPAPGTEIDTNAIASPATPHVGWTVLEKLIVAVSRKIAIVCAAGNDGESQLIYPARLAADDNGIVAVGSVTPKGYRSGYANYGNGLTLVAPSDDSEVYNRHQTRIDRTTPYVAMHHYDPRGGAVVPYSHLQLLTMDLPGTFGYEGGSEPFSAVLPPAANPGTGGGYYTGFGGTSGAAALVAGAAALAVRAHRARYSAGMEGMALKATLVAACDQDATVWPGTQALQADPMNADGEPSKGKTYYFGAGLLDAGSVVDAILEG